MIREIIRMGDKRLLRVAPPVTNLGSAELRALVADMFETMDDARGVGLAAPQIAVDLQLMVFGFEASERYPDAPAVPRTALANAQIEPLSDEMENGWEGCLSIPGLRAVIPRYRHIRYRGFAPDGSPIEREAEGFHARVVQHEYDHLVGRLYPRGSRTSTPSASKTCCPTTCRPSVAAAPACDKGALRRPCRAYLSALKRRRLGPASSPMRRRLSSSYSR